MGTYLFPQVYCTDLSTSNLFPPPNPQAPLCVTIALNTVWIQLKGHSGRASHIWDAQ